MENRYTFRGLMMIRTRSSGKFPEVQCGVEGKDFMDAENRRIQDVIKGIDPEDDWAAMQQWGRHLRKVLKFPFPAKAAEPQDKGPLRTGDKVVVARIVDVDDLYGVIVDIHNEDEYGSYTFLLCDLEVMDRKLRAYRVVRDYVVWFANR